MFNKYGFFITREELVGFFEIVDLNRDFSLNLEEFKACMLDDKAK
jgi:Ca2+-binding EF-hand superfamily protein